MLLIFVMPCFTIFKIAIDLLGIYDTCRHFLVLNTRQIFHPQSSLFIVINDRWP